MTTPPRTDTRPAASPGRITTARTTTTAASTTYFSTTPCEGAGSVRRLTFWRRPIGAWPPTTARWWRPLPCPNHDRREREQDARCASVPRPAGGVRFRHGAGVPQYHRRRFVGQAGHRGNMVEYRPH